MSPNYFVAGPSHIAEFVLITERKFESRECHLKQITITILNEKFNQINR